ncbi:molybdopterin molybdotransferase MoeA [Metallosphaera tengchongensis]|uniref:Molybdopterin molybdotransferase MoeA n=1 Tax=Metallosphaera tengchongensis TaxID=1532350 RepID=A0A6N0NS14_9CREN|nr:molybdopterin molybdotransferase MoeA [Metallosphaera tengchongensis]QKQ99653.1 molybdopterin molybdotransferase MoeA [Metallosphaera tengchongensis]
MLVPIEEARSLIEKMPFQAARVTELTPYQAIGKVVAEDVRAIVDTPSRDVSAMDGYAFRYDDLLKYGALRIVGELFPKSVSPPSLNEGEAYYVTTGSPIPLGADTVARVEYTKVENGLLRVNGPISRGKDVRKRGEDVKSGDLLIARGTFLTPYHIPILEQQKIKSLKVFDVNFCVFGNGDEILPWGETGEGIPDSISPFFLKLLERFGKVKYQGVARDSLDDVKKLLSKCLVYDYVISIGGSSVGEKDFVKRATSEMGHLIFEGVSTNVIKRGGLGEIFGKPVLILPGQIISAITVFHEHGLHVLSRMTGVELREYVRAKLGFRIDVDHKMDSVYLVKLDGGDAYPLRWGVGLYSELGKASGFTILKRGLTYKQGDEVIVQRFI